mmetsp:Transcript_50051/g.119583  ORF Transcript_50051/g.119583 Transcript_50051/m.119583 type:complete len:236 (-) Transcript_50051:1854-2561(-)
MQRASGTCVRHHPTNSTTFRAALANPSGSAWPELLQKAGRVSGSSAVPSHPPPEASVAPISIRLLVFGLVIGKEGTPVLQALQDQVLSCEAGCLAVLVRRCDILLAHGHTVASRLPQIGPLLLEQLRLDCRSSAVALGVGWSSSLMQRRAPFAWLWQRLRADRSLARRRHRRSRRRCCSSSNSFRVWSSCSWCRSLLSFGNSLALEAAGQPLPKRSQTSEVNSGRALRLPPGAAI